MKYIYIRKWKNLTHCYEKKNILESDVKILVPDTWNIFLNDGREKDNYKKYNWQLLCKYPRMFITYMYHSCLCGLKSPELHVFLDGLILFSSLVLLISSPPSAFIIWAWISSCPSSLSTQFKTPENWDWILANEII